MELSPQQLPIYIFLLLALSHSCCSSGTMSAFAQVPPRSVLSLPKGEVKMGTVDRRQMSFDYKCLDPPVWKASTSLSTPQCLEVSPRGCLLFDWLAHTIMNIHAPCYLMKWNDSSTGTELIVSQRHLSSKNLK